MGDLTQLYEKAAEKRAEFNSNLVLKSWQDPAFRGEFLADPKKALENQIGKKAPENVQVRALEETGNKVYFVIPQKPVIPSSEETLTDEALAGVAAGLGVLFRGETTTSVPTKTGTEVVKSPAVLLVWFD